jgi:hypothetical protein
MGNRNLKEAMPRISSAPKPHTRWPMAFFPEAFT